MDTVVDALRAVLPPLAVATDAETLARHSHDDAEWAPYGLPAAVVFASRVDDVVATVRIAAERGVPVVPRGAGTGLSGGANATSGCLVLSLERMTRIVAAMSGGVDSSVAAALLARESAAEEEVIGVWMRTHADLPEGYELSRSCCSPGSWKTPSRAASGGSTSCAARSGTSTTSSPRRRMSTP